MACERETAAVKSYGQCYVDGGLGTVGVVRLPIVHRLGGTGDQRDLAGQVGRPGCSFSRFAAHCLGGSGGHAREDLRLLLGSPHFGKYGSEENHVVDTALEALILDLLEWLATADRSHDDVMNAWRTSCPKLPVWEEANDRGLVLKEDVNGRCVVRITSSGRDLLVQRNRGKQHE